MSDTQLAAEVGYPEEGCPSDAPTDNEHTVEGVPHPTEEGEQGAADGAADEGADGDAAEDEPRSEGEDVDYAALALRDLEELRAEFPELSSVGHITELRDPLRYAALRDLGLTPREAYLATAPRARAAEGRAVGRQDGRAHLTGAVPRSAGSPHSGMTSRQLAEARELFGDLSDSEIRALYKRVND